MRSFVAALSLTASGVIATNSSSSTTAAASGSSDTTAAPSGSSATTGSSDTTTTTTTTPFAGWANNIISAPDGCFMGNMNPATNATDYLPAACSAANTININVNSTGPANCAWRSHTNLAAASATNGGILIVFGHEAAKVPGCCNALVDLSTSGWLWNFGVISMRKGCSSNECVPSTAENLRWGTTYAKEFYPGKNYSVGAVAGVKGSDVGLMPSQDALRRHLAYLFANNEKCFTDSLAYTAATGTTNWNHATTFMPAMQYTYIPAIRSAFHSSVQVAANANLCYSKTGPFPKIDCSTAASDDIKVNDDGNGGTQANCLWRSHSDITPFTGFAGASTNGFLAAFGPEVAAISGCCQAIVDLTQYGWLDIFSTYGMTSFCTTTECIGGASMNPVTNGDVDSHGHIKKGAWLTKNFTVSGASDYTQVLPSYNKMVSNMDVLVQQNNGACMKAAMSYIGSKASWGHIAGLNGAWSAGAGKEAALVAMYPYHTTTTTTTTAGNTTSSPSTGTTVTTAAPAIEVASSYTAAETLPAGTSETTLMASSNYVTAKQEGLATALAVSTSAVTITGFSITSSRRALSGNVSNSTSTTVSFTVKTNFKVTVADDTAATGMITALGATTLAAAIKTATDSAMTSKTWSTSFAKPVIATPTAIAVGVKATVPTLTVGTWTKTYYGDATCSTAHSTKTTPLTGAIGACVADSSDSLEVISCSNVASIHGHSGATDCTGSASTSSMKVGICTGSGSDYEMLVCTAPAAATSNAFAAGVSAMTLAFALMF